MSDGDARRLPAAASGGSWIACDLDNTLCLQAAALRREIRKRYGVLLVGGPDFDAYAPLDDHGVTRADIEALFRDGEVFRSVSVRPGARTALEQMRAAGHHIAIVTDRFWYTGIESDTRRWLADNEIPHDELAIVPAARKGEYTRADPARRFVAFFEDRLDTARDLSADVPAVFLLDFPWNRTAAPLPANVARVPNWLAWRQDHGPRFGLPPLPEGGAHEVPAGERPLVIGLTGLPGSGKQAAHEVLLGHGFRSYTFSSVIRQEWRARGVDDPTRQQLQDLGDALRREHGPGVLAQRLTRRIAADRARLAVVDGLRHPAEWHAVRRDAGVDSLLVAIEVEPAVHFERIRERGRPGDPGTWEDFVTMDERERGDGDIASGTIQVATVMAMADAVVDNAGRPDELVAQIEEMLRPYFERGRSMQDA